MLKDVKVERKVFDRISPNFIEFLEMNKNIFYSYSKKYGNLVIIPSSILKLFEYHNVFINSVNNLS